ncbi:serine hydrolase [Kordiimonas sp. SCSIO 12610]|uniref:serine hydrolase n=1 Tax=Kordiimonas sp. SCSIO 12610 TaxID=2829597 RepID=UPI002109E520|nr:serine hydrolase [Kordiimonas sp. SCSIO 12610]UTW56585.1 serine hydrolase [Kordiimonas sp. SCSIO 12610]
MSNDLHEAKIKKTQNVIAEYLDAGWFSGNVAVFSQDKVVFRHSYGFSDIDQEKENTDETRIRIGSINKHYTAALVLRLVDQGLISLDDTLDRFALGFPHDIGAKITVRHLLSHRSGFKDIFTEEYMNTYQSLKTISDKMPLLLDEPLLFEPGSDHAYSNYGYIILGAIVEKVSGQDFRQVLQDEILEIIGAENTFYVLTDEVPGKARSYQFTSMGGKRDMTSRLENVTPDGGMYASASDLALFYSRLLYSNDILSDGMKAVMASGYQLSPPEWDEIMQSDGAMWNSYGGGPGVSAAVEISIRDRLFVIVLANTDGLVAERISQRLVSVFAGHEPKPMELPVSVFAMHHLQERGLDQFRLTIGQALRDGGYEGYTDRPLNRLGLDLMREGKSEHALQVLLANVDMFPNLANPHDSLAYLHEQIGNREEAVAAYRRALEIDASLSSALEGLKRLEDS